MDILEKYGTEISLGSRYFFLRRVPHTKKWNLCRRGHRVGGPHFISRHRNLEFALKAFEKAELKKRKK